MCWLIFVFLTQLESSLFSALVPGLVPSITVGARKGSVTLLNQWIEMLTEACE